MRGGDRGGNGSSEQGRGGEGRRQGRKGGGCLIVVLLLDCVEHELICVLIKSGKLTGT